MKFLIKGGIRFDMYQQNKVIDDTFYDKEK